MLVHKAFRYRVYPTPKQVTRLEEWERALRTLWNLAHEQRLLGLARSKAERHYYTAYDQIKQLKELRAEFPWMADVPSNVCSQLLVELDKSWQRYFKKLTSRPHWKKHGRSFLSLCEPHSKDWNLRNSILRFPKLGYLRTVVHRPTEGTLKSCTLKREADQWFASLVCEVNLPTPTPRLGPLVALDRGVILAVADSEGNQVPSPQFYSKSLKRLARAQRKLARKEKGSANREKARLRVAKIHRKVSRQREHFVQTLSHQYSKSHGVIAIEKLQIGSMVRANRGLARGILDAGWGRLEVCLRYKQAWSGGSVLEVPAHYSSQTCSECGHVDKKSRRSQSEFVCTACGHAENADTNAAKVLKNRAIRSVLPAEGMLPENTQRRRKGLRSVRKAPKVITVEASSLEGSLLC